MRKADRTKTGVIFNIQKFSVNDGPGIRTVVFFKGCPLRCRWCSNPESQLTKVQVLWDEKKCLGCHHCIDICPVEAISLREGHIHIDALHCQNCGRCTAECPAKALKTEGEERTVQQVIDVVVQDEVFYEEGGGGITLSGGEFLSQPDFAEELLLAAKEEGLHTCCETTGFAPTEVFARITQYIDYVLMDMKHWDATRHKDGTGATNELPLANMAAAIQMGKTLLPRIPVIPGFNDALEDAAQLAKTLHRVGANTCQLLPFHQFGENKYHLLDKEYAYQDLPSLHREDLTDYLAVFQQNGINAFF